MVASQDRQDEYKRQKEYRARQAQVHALLCRLWRMRHLREYGYPARGLEPEDKWNELAALMRRLVAEEEIRQEIR